ncbi:TIGR01212 family radical SAM protein [Desulfatibacillum alkenivorans]|nr:TIGR01212 family radical SAM protein [Desulfatibacillum alkenivorans]
MNEKPYKDLAGFLRSHFGCRVQKITLDAGLSCPNRDGTLGRGGCIYCNERGSGTGAALQGLSITQQLERGKETLGRRYKAKKFLAYFQAHTNTYAPVERLQALYREALAVPGVVGLCIGTRPDCVDEKILALLEDLAAEAMIWAEYGLQSRHDKTLDLINRGHDAACFEKTVVATAGRNILTCAHVILGLPGENREDMLETARYIAALPVDGVKIHLMYVVRGTALHRIYEQGRYQCMEQEDYVETVHRFLELLPPDMVIQRLTGDPHRDELVAPEWSLRKGETITLIHESMARENSRQGRFYSPS